MPSLLHTSAPPTYLPTTGQRQAVVQPKLTVNAPGDRHEQEANTLASQAVGGEKVTVNQRVIGGDGMAVSAQLGRGGGVALPADTRSVMENAFSADFAQVRVHADAGAAQLNRQVGAKAFTHGRDIYFNQGQYAPQTTPGQHLLAHELTHTIQQGGAGAGLLQREEATATPAATTSTNATAAPTTAAPTPFQPAQEQWQNTTLAPTIYPFREQMYHRLLDLYGSAADTKELTGNDLYRAVRDTLTTSNIPIWAQQAFLEHAGMRYHSAHSTALPPWLLIDILDELQNPNVAGQPRRRRTSVKSANAADLLGQLQQQHADGTIPDDAWQYIVQRTDLRLDTTDADWQKAGYQQVADPIWKKALGQWTTRGYTLWRETLMSTNALHTTSIVCNELAEVTERHRGVSLPGGIAANADALFSRAAQAPVTPAAAATAAETAAETPRPTAPFFVHGPNVTHDHLKPGASLFFLDSAWKNSPAEAHERVKPYPGVDFPVPWTVAEGEQEKKDNEGKKPKDQTHKSHTTGRPVIREGYVDADGWVYHIGNQISRSKPLGSGMAGPVQAQYMHWSHQATVVGPVPAPLQKDGTRKGDPSKENFVTMETTSIGAGVNVRSLSSLKSQFVFIGWVPDGAGATTTFTPPAAP